MKIDVNQLANKLTQDKKNLAIVLSLVAVLVVAMLFLLVHGHSKKTASGPGGNMPAEAGNMAGGMPGGMPGNEPMPGGSPAMGNSPAPGAPAGMPGAPGEMAPSGAPGAPGAPGAAPDAGAGASSEAANDGTTFPKGPPVEPFRADPFVTKAKRHAPFRQPVLAPLVVAIEPPKAMVVPPTVNVIPASVVSSSKAIAQEVQRRLSGVLWNGSVAAILETPEDPQHKSVILRPGDYVGENLRVQSIKRDQMTLINEAARGRNRQIVVNLKPAAAGVAAGLAPGYPGGAPGPMGPGNMTP
ncbi:MAG TPA: hypothetical protein VHR86_01580 [Armatimonadota bacterium]|nr:hypothetical protein [Armatimonadota bacterium]